MKKLFLLIHFVTTTCLTSGQLVVESDCSASDSIKAMYEMDAKQLTIRKIFRENLNYKDSVTIPQYYMDTAMKSLLAVYNAKGLPARDSVVNLFRIHTFPEHDLRSIYIMANSGLDWMKQLKQGITPTGDTTIDSLLAQYHLNFSYYYDYRSIPSDVVRFISDSTYNIPALSQVFKTLDGVEDAGPGEYAGDGSNITESTFQDHVELVYSFGWGDCQAGCNFRRYWKFKVYPDCSVAFVESYGDEIPALGSNNIYSEKLNFYPNPFQNMIFIEGIASPSKYTLTNLLGQTILTGKINHNKIDHLENLAPGIYWLHIHVKDKIITEKLIKM